MLWALIVLVIGVSAAGVEILQLKRLYDSAEKYVNAGASINVLAAAGRINPQACEALNQIDGIRAAGAIKETGTSITLTTLPSAPIPEAEITPHFPQLLHADTSDTPGVIIADQVYEYTLSEPGQYLHTTAGKIPVNGIYSYPDDGRLSGYGYMMLSLTRDGTHYDECWADIWPESPEKTALLYTALEPDGGNERQTPMLTQLNPTLGTSFQGIVTYEQRITRFLPAIVGIVVCGIGFVMIRIRRLDYASALHARVARHDVFLIIVIGTMYWLLPTLILLEMFSVLMSEILVRSVDETALLLANRNIVTIPVALMIGIVIAWQLTREKHLFRYFKTR